LTRADRPVPHPEAAAALFTAARDTLDTAERQLACDEWHLTPHDVEVARQGLAPLDELAALADPGGDRQRVRPGPGEEAVLQRDALAAVAVAVLRAEGDLRRLLAATRAALEPLVHPCAAGPGAPLSAAHGDAGPYTAAQRADAELLRHRLRTVLHAGLAAHDPHVAPLP
jgi:hypothetical protein